ncbi:MAG TPA: flagellar M-ring protein FliF C-terminal domain-containing protein [Candidatus Tumulicola sp.]
MQYLAIGVQRWNALSKGVRTVAIACVALSCIVVIALEIVAHPSRTALFATPLHPEQVSEVEERLAAWNVAFSPSTDNVVVDASRRSDLLLRLSLSGVPHAHVEGSGEALTNVGMLTPQAVIDAQARAGLAGDIETGLRGIDGVEEASVIVAPAKIAEFADQSSRDASAGVRLRLRSGARLSQQAVQGIRAFVAAAVPGLDPSRVTLLDDRGVALDGRDAGSDDNDLQRSLQSALDGAFGEGAAIVRVRTERTSERSSERDTDRRPLGEPVSYATRAETFDGSGKRYRLRDESGERGESTRERQSDAEPGALARISAAVYVDATRHIDVAAIRDLAAATIGIDPKRGDSLAVQAIDFGRAPVARKDSWWLLYGAIVPLLPAIVVAVAVLLVTRLVLPPALEFVRCALERASLRRTSSAVAGFAPSRVRTVLAQEPPHAAAAIISALPAATAAAVLELYPQLERDAIVQRMQRPHSPLVGDAQELLRRHA